MQNLAIINDTTPACLPREARFQSLVEAFSDKLYHYAYWRCGCPKLAEDLVQETWMRAWRALDSLREIGAAQGWLFTILRREHARLFERQRPDLADVELETLPSASRDHDTSIEALVLHQALDSLPDSYRRPLEMQVLDGYSYDEIAKHMGISPAAVTSRLHRARNRLKAMMTEDSLD